MRTLDRFPEELKKAGAAPILLDFCSSDDEIVAAAEDALNVYGHVDVLMNNAGGSVTGVGPVEELRYVVLM